MVRTCALPGAALLGASVLCPVWTANAQCAGWVPLARPYDPVMAVLVGAQLRAFDLDGDGPEPARLFDVGLSSECCPASFDRVKVYSDTTEQWSTVGRFEPAESQWGPRTYVTCAEVFQGQLVIGGFFSGVDGVPARNLAAWDGNRWNALGGGTTGDDPMPGRLTALAVHNGELIVAGEITAAGGVPAVKIAAWNGFWWRAIGTNLATDYSIREFAVWQGKLFGLKSAWGSMGLDQVVRWDGQVWTRTGPPGYVENPQRLTTARGKLVVTAAEDGGTGNLYSFDGTSWEAHCVYCQSSWGSVSVDSLATFDYARAGLDGLVAGVTGYDWWDETSDYFSFGAVAGFDFVQLPPPGPGFRPWTSVLYAGELVFPYQRLINGYPYAHVQPRDVLTCTGGEAELFFGVTNTLSPPTYRWSRNGDELTDGTTEHGSVISGSSTPALRLVNAGEPDEGWYECRAVNGLCGQVISAQARLLVCASDFDCNGSLDFFDYLDFISAWDREEPRADLTGDGQIDFFDYLAFVESYGGGCGR